MPEWVVTFGDMMSLLLCFFILIQMFSELKQPRQYQRVVDAIREAFGYVGGVGQVPVDDPPLRSMIEAMEAAALRSTRETTRVSQNTDPGVDGSHARVTRIREGVVFTTGGPQAFDELSAKLKPGVRREIEQLVPLLRGRNNRIEIIGHAAAKYIPAGSPWPTLDDLAFARAAAVRDVLIEAGLRDEVFRIVAAGVREPIRPRASDPADIARNRRVEIILSEILVDEANTDAHHTDEQAARGGGS